MVASDMAARGLDFPNVTHVVNLDAPMQPRAYLPLAIAALSGGFGQVFVGRAYARGRAATLSAVAYSGVVMTYLFEVAVFHSVPEWHQAAGAVLVIAAGVLVSLRG